MRSITTAVVLLLATGCGSSGFQGTVVDGITGQPLPNFKMIAKADAEVGLTCLTFEGTSGADGTFTVDGACVGETSYTLQPDDASYWLAETSSVAKGTDGAVTVKAWRTGGKSANLYHLRPDGVGTLPTGSDMTEETILDTAEKVKYPKSLPSKTPLVGPGEYIVLNGQETIDKMKFAPLIHSGPRNFGMGDEPVEITNPWWYVGVEFTSDTEFARKEVTIDESKVVTHSHDGMAVKWIPAEAFGVSHMAVWRDGGRRMYIVDTMEAHKKPAPPAEEEAAN